MSKLFCDFIHCRFWCWTWEEMFTHQEQEHEHFGCRREGT